ncbi:hypothetical protein SAMN04487828_1873 [Prevotella sp. lc2012]|nr:hypothetical protein SAMN04487828_1873 [Prevotella sp. lc2012]
MKTNKAKHDAYEKPAMRVIQMRENLQLLAVSSIDGAEDD